MPSPEPPQIEALVNDLAIVPHEEWAIVLDDHALIDSDSVHGVAPFLLEHLPDGAQHLIIASRVDPPLSLSRRRASANGFAHGEPTSRSRTV